MANVDLDVLQARARSAYERGRWRLGALAAWPAFVMAGICVALDGRPFATLVMGAVLAAVIAKATHYGRGAARAVIPGLLTGALPLIAGLIACRVPHVCGVGLCLSWCAPLCLTAGGLAGLVLGVRAKRAPAERRLSLLVATSIAVLTGALGCLVVGLGGIVGMVLGLSVGATVGLVPRQRHS
jgi:hypothetical protein